jgi:hypothetical protein
MARSWVRVPRRDGRERRPAIGTPQESPGHTGMLRAAASRMRCPSIRAPRVLDPAGGPPAHDGDRSGRRQPPHPISELHLVASDQLGDAPQPHDRESHPAMGGRAPRGGGPSRSTGSNCSKIAKVPVTRYRCRGSKIPNLAAPTDKPCPNGMTSWKASAEKVARRVPRAGPGNGPGAIQAPRTRPNSPAECHASAESNKCSIHRRQAEGPALVRRRERPARAADV